jgi:aldehyde:ferredoxin oxidoreductase
VGREFSYDTSQLDVLLDEYYQRRGWSIDGIPTKEKIKDIERNTIKI